MHTTMMFCGMFLTNPPQTYVKYGVRVFGSTLHVYTAYTHAG